MRTIPRDFSQVMQTLSAMDLRIGQIFDNLRLTLAEEGKDIFYMENEELVEHLRKMLPPTK